MMTRRDALKKTGLVLAAATVAAVLPNRGAAAAAEAPASGPFSLPPLPYAADALEPFIDAQTMQIHHDRHHRAYVDNLNKAVAGHPDLEKKSVEALLRDLASVPENIRKAVQNHGGGHANHTLFWQWLKKNDGAVPTGALARALERKWGGLDGFKTEFTKAATTVFGSGWAWLSFDGEDLVIEQTPNQDSVLMRGHTPVLGIDVWEHAYYLKYQNRRPEYIAAFYNVINWEEVSSRYTRISERLTG
jgi:superoxide dismutase, Fe-Mn family